jgi:hypothetical protein
MNSSKRRCFLLIKEKKTRPAIENVEYTEKLHDDI